MQRTGGRPDRGDRATEQFRKLFIGGLSPNVDDDGLKEFFEQWGELVDVVVMKDKNTGRSRGFGFVTYREEASVDAAQAARPHTLEGKEVDTKRAMPRESSTDDSIVTVKKLFVSGLKPETTDSDLHNYFCKYGEVESAEIATWKESGKSRGFGFVTFADSDSVDKAILYKPHHVGTCRCDCKKALSKEEMAKVRTKQDQQRAFSGNGDAFGFSGWNNQGNSMGYTSQMYDQGGFGDNYGYGQQQQQQQVDWSQQQPYEDYSCGGFDMNGGFDAGFGNYNYQTYSGGAMKQTHFGGGVGGGRPQPYHRDSSGASGSLLGRGDY